MKPDFLSQNLWDTLPEDWREELLLESGRRFRRGVLREQAFMEACASVLLDEVWAFFGVDDFDPPILWPMLLENDVSRRHPALLRSIHLLALAKTSPLVVAKLRDEPEQLFYLADGRAPKGDCPHCGLILRPDEENDEAEESVHAECEQDYAAVREEMGRRLIAESMQSIDGADLDEDQEEDDLIDDVEFLRDLEPVARTGA